ncbi:hypothetical protein ABLN85_07540, partial [Mycobacterium tuberculosis]
PSLAAVSVIIWVFSPDLVRLEQLFFRIYRETLRVFRAPLPLMAQLLEGIRADGITTAASAGSSAMK